MKKFFKNILKFSLRFLPIKLLIFFLKKILYFKFLSLKTENVLKNLLDLDNFIYQLTGKFAVKYGNGIHVKKRLINYIDYFELQTLKVGGPCIDIGCGDGELAKRISENKIYVLGIDKSKKMIQKAKKYESKYLRFIENDFLNINTKKKFNVVILSNVLEHVNQRISFLNNIIKKIKPKFFIIRVPAFDRDWRVPLKKELGIEWRLDSTHYIEYTKETLLDELLRSNIDIIDYKSAWGEIWLTGKVKR